MRRLGAFILGIIFGWVLLFGGIAVAAYTVSLSTFNIKLDYQDEEGKKLDEMSFADIITKGVKLASGGTLSLQAVQNTYGIDLLGMAGLTGENYAQLKQKTLQQISADPAGSLSCVSLADFFKSDMGKKVYSMPESVLTAWEDSDASVGDIVEGDFQTLLTGVRIKDFMTNLTTEGIMGIIASKDLGGLFATLKAEGGDPIAYMCEGLFVGDIMGYDLPEQDISEATTVIEGKVKKIGQDFYRAKLVDEETTWHLAQLMCDKTTEHVHDENCYKYVYFSAENEKANALMNALGNLQLDSLIGGSIPELSEITAGLYVGDLMNYTKTGDIWMNGSTEIDTLTSTVADIKISELLGDGFSVETAFDGLYIGDLLGYQHDETTDTWTKTSGSLSEMEKTLAKISIEELMGDDFSISGIFDDLKIGELMGYSYEENIWYSGEGETKKPVGKLMAEFADVSVSELTGGSFDALDTLGSLKVGELLDYTYNATEGKWYNGTTAIDDKIMNNVYSTVIDDMDTIDLDNIVGYIGEVMGFFRKEITNPSTYTTRIGETSVYTNGTLLAIKDGDKYYEAKCTNAEVHTHTADCTFENVWYTDSACTTLVSVLESKLADIKAGELTSSFGVDSMLDGLELGDIMGYHKDGSLWFDASNQEVDSLTQKIADMTYNELKTNFDIMGIFGDTMLGELMNYSHKEITDTTGYVNLFDNVYANGASFAIKEGEIFYEAKLGCSNNDVAHTHTLLCYTKIWYTDPSTPADTMTQKIADKTMSSIQNGFDIMDTFGDLQLGELMGYTLTGSDWYDGATQVSKVMQKIADMTMTDIQGGFEIGEVFGGLSVGELFGYTLTESLWYDGDEQVNTLTQNLCNMVVSDLTSGSLNMDALLDDVTLGDIITINASSPVILQKLADKQVLDISDSMSSIYIGDLQNYVRKELSTAEIAGYTLKFGNVYENGTHYAIKEGDKYFAAKTTCGDSAHTHTADCFEQIWYEDSGFSSEVSGVQQLLVNMTVSNLDISDIVTKINNLKFTDVIDGIDTSTGAFKLIDADTTIGNLPTALSTAVQTSTIQELMDARLLEISTENAAKLDILFISSGVEWRGLSFGGFISELLSAV